MIPQSGLTLREEFAGYDAQRKFDLVYRKVTRHSACICDRVLRGIARPLGLRPLREGLHAPDVGRALHGQPRGGLHDLADLSWAVLIAALFLYDQRKY